MFAAAEGMSSPEPTAALIRSDCVMEVTLEAETTCDGGLGRQARPAFAEGILIVAKEGRYLDGERRQTRGVRRNRRTAEPQPPGELAQLVVAARRGRIHPLG